MVKLTVGVFQILSNYSEAPWTGIKAPTLGNPAVLHVVILRNNDVHTWLHCLHDAACKSYTVALNTRVMSNFDDGDSHYSSFCMFINGFLINVLYCCVNAVN